MRIVEIITSSGQAFSFRQPSPDLHADIAALAEAVDTAPPKGTPIVFETPWGAFCTSDRDQWPAEVTDHIVQMFTPKLF